MDLRGRDRGDQSSQFRPDDELDLVAEADLGRSWSTMARRVSRLMSGQAPATSMKRSTSVSV